MDELMRALRRIGAWFFAVTLGLVAMLFVLRALLPALANTATAFIATPGGLLLVAAAWWWLHRKKHGR